jgi:L-iditol 2-dehydrogenase
MPFALSNLDPGRRGFGFGVDGAMTHYTKVPERLLHHLPATLPFEVAALTEPCCVAYNATCGNARVLPGDAVAVIGPGPIGLICAAMAKLAGAGELIVIGTAADTRRLQVAEQIGASATLGAKGEDIVDLGPEFSRIFPLAEWHRAFAAMHSGEIVKAVLLPAQ